jgi:hypothetical protein
VFFDYFSDPPKCPQFGLVAVSASPFQQPFFQLIDLFFRQTARPSRRTVGFKKGLAIFWVGFFSVANRTGTGPDKTGDLLVPVALFQQRDGLPPALLQLFGRSCRSHVLIIGHPAPFRLTFKRAIISDQI